MTSITQVTNQDTPAKPFDPQKLKDGDYTILDARGLICPEPVMLLHNKMRTIDSNHIVKVLTTDPSSERDIHRFCDFLHHPLLLFSIQSEEFIFWIQKK